MKPMQGWRRRLAVALLCLGVAGGGWADDLEIRSFNDTGQLTFNELSTAMTYRVEWAPTPAGPWTNSWSALSAIPAVGSGVVTCSVPMCYRVVASVTNPPLYLVVDLSDGPSATNYPVSSMTAAPGGGWTDEYKTTKIVFLHIPAGTFTMGSPGDELGHGDNETQHQVTLSQDFYIGVFHVTQKQWERVMGTWPSLFSNASYRDARPVEQVTYDDIRGSTLGTNWPATSTVDASSFMGLLRAKTGRTFDLPTESQWEYACRAGTTTALNSGTNLTSTDNDPSVEAVGRYWYNGGSGGDSDSNGDTSVGTAKVGSYLPNAWGLYDMHGNVCEWCLDWYGDPPGTVTDPKGPSSGSCRVDRGGGYHNTAGACRSAWRNSDSPDSGYANLGFRAVLLPCQ